MKQTPIREKLPFLRQRRRSDGTWRVWLEPSTAAVALGFAPVELDPDRPAKAIAEAKRYAQDVAGARATGARPTRRGGSRTMAALIAKYRRDPEFSEKRPATQRTYAANLSIIAQKWGDELVTSFTKPVVREWYVTNRAARGETAAVALNRQLSILFSYAELIGWRDDGNPAKGIKMKSTRRRDRVLTWPEFDALLAAADAAGLRSIGAAVALAVLQGQRSTDIREARADQFRQIDTLALDPVTGDTVPVQVWAWKLVRSKRGNLGAMRLHALALEYVLERMTDRAADDYLLRDERTGGTYAGDPPELFGRRFREVRAIAAQSAPSLTADPVQFRDLRRTFGVWARGGGATDDDVGDVLGNSAALDAGLQETYMPASFDTASRAVMSIRRPDHQGKKRA